MMNLDTAKDALKNRLKNYGSSASERKDITKPASEL